MSVTVKFRLLIYVSQMGHIPNLVATAAGLRGCCCSPRIPHVRSLAELGVRGRGVAGIAGLASNVTGKPFSSGSSVAIYSVWLCSETFENDRGLSFPAPELFNSCQKNCMFHDWSLKCVGVLWKIASLFALIRSEEHL